MTEVILTYTDPGSPQEKINCNYTKTREGWLEIALTTNKPHKRIFIPAHMLSRVTTIDDGGNDNFKPNDQLWGG